MNIQAIKDTQCLETLKKELRATRCEVVCELNILDSKVRYTNNFNDEHVTSYKANKKRLRIIDDLLEIIEFSLGCMEE